MLNDITFRDLPYVKGRIYEGNDLSATLGAIASWLGEDPTRTALAIKTEYSEDGEAVTVFYEELPGGEKCARCRLS